MRNKSVSLDIAITRFIQSKCDSNRRGSYIKSLRLYLNQFARGRGTLQVNIFSTEHIEQWFLSRNEKPSTRASNLGRLSSFFGFCARHKFVHENPCDKLDRIFIERKPPIVLSPNQIFSSLEFTANMMPRFLLYLVLGTFPGARPNELRQLHDNEILGGLSQKILRIDAAASKVRRRRIITLTDQSIEWINYAFAVGGSLPIPHSYSRRCIRKLRHHLGFDSWPQDILRHTALTYLLAIRRNVSDVAFESGNSEAIILTNYNGLATPEQVEKFQSIYPPHV